MRLVLIGAPGAGKGTQSQFLADEYGLAHISTGNILRSNIKSGTELGRIAETCLQRGELVPDDLILKLVEERLAESDCERGYILDGFPRTLAQARSFGGAKKIDFCINIDIDIAALVERLSGRRVCAECGRSFHVTLWDGDKCDTCPGELIQRNDDSPATVLARVEVYNRETLPLIDYYRQLGVLVNVDGNQSPEKVFEDINKSLHSSHKL